MTPTSLEDTLDRLDTLLAETGREGSYLAVFPAMYRSVTACVRQAVRTGGFFEDDERVERLTTVFAGLYLEAVTSHRVGEPASASWTEAFRVAEAPRRRMILQHLLLGMNAHINLDLGVATAKAAGPRLPVVYGDFVRVNEILFDILDLLQSRLGEASPRMSLLDRLGGPLDEGFMKIGIRTARDLAWHFAEAVHETSDQAQPIDRRDRDVARLARAISRPWSPIDLVGRIVCRAESTDLPEVTRLLVDNVADLDRAAARAARTLEQPPGEERSLRAARRHHLDFLRAR